MTPVTLAIDLLVIPLLFVIVAAWCSVAAGMIRSIGIRLRRAFVPGGSGQLLDLSSFFSDMGSSLRSRSVIRIAGVFYFRPIDGLLIWVAMLVAGMIVMAIWSAFVILVFGHYP